MCCVYADLIVLFFLNLILSIAQIMKTAKTKKIIIT